MNVPKKSRAFHILFLTVKWLKAGSDGEQTAMTRVVVGYGRTGRSVVRFSRSAPCRFGWPMIIWIRSKDRPGTLRHCEGAQQLPNYPLQAARLGSSVLVSHLHPVFKLAIDQGVQLINDLHLFAQEVSGLLVGVTGSNGKSTVVHGRPYRESASDSFHRRRQYRITRP